MIMFQGGYKEPKKIFAELYAYGQPKFNSYLQEIAQVTICIE